MKKKIIFIIASNLVVISLVILLFVYLNSGSSNNTSGSNSDNKIDIEENNIDWDSNEEKLVTDSENGITITESGTYTLTGEINGQVIINTNGNVKIILNNVTINSSKGPCIMVKEADNVLIYLESGTVNTLTDSTNYSGYEEEVAVIFSHDDLTLDGEGTLKITANMEDGIVSKDDLTIKNGTYVITSKDDGIRGKDSVHVINGTFTIDAGGDGIKSSNDTDASKGYVYIESGNFNIKSDSDGIQAITKLIIDDGTITTNSSEGLEATYVVINGGTININATDDGINASNKSTFMTATIEINGGNLTIKMGQGDTDALDANGNLYINGGTVNITAQSPFDYDSEGKINGGEVYVNGEKVTQLTNQMMGGQPGGHGGRR